MSKRKIFWKSDSATLYLGDAKGVIDSLPADSVDCIVTSPPYYGQRDYGSDEQIGLESTPSEFVNQLVSVFASCRRVLKDTGSLWVNIGDTYWSGKGRPTCNDKKNPHRRFERPQDKTSRDPICKPKQLLLVPARFAIAMQDSGWIVRNDIIWSKTNPTPDPAKDRLACAHEYFYFFAKVSHGYYFNRESIAIPRQGKGTKSPATVWQLTSRPSFKKHIAPFQNELLTIPLNAGLPPGGVILDPFCGSGTALRMALLMGGERRAIGIDINSDFLLEAKAIISGTV